MNTSLFMDKQIMDLSNSQNNNSYDSIDLMNTSEEQNGHIAGGGGGGGSIKKEEIVPSYDFQPIRPIGTSSPPASIDSGNVNVAGARPWGSADSKPNTSPIRNYGSLDSLEPAKVILGKDRDSVDATMLSEIDRTMKKYADNLLHALEGVSARLSQLETRNRQLENSMDDLKVSVGNIHGSTDGKMRHLENILREVQTGVQVIKDKQEIMDTHLQLAKLHVSKVEQQPEVHNNTVSMDSVQPVASAPQQYHQQLPPVSPAQPPPVLPPPNAPPPPPAQQNLPQHLQLPNQFPPNQIPSVPQRDSYYSQPGQTPENAGQRDSYYSQPGQTTENAGQQYQMPPSQQMHSAPQPPPQQQYQAPPQPQYSQQPPSPRPHHSLPAVNPSQPQPPLGHHPEEMPYMQSQNYPQGVHQPPPHPAIGAPPSQQFYGPPPNMYEPQSGRPGPGFPGAYGPSSAPSEQYSYSTSTSQYGGGSSMKPQQLSAPPMGQSTGTGYPQLPTAKILPQALPTAAPVGGGSGSGSGSGGGNRVPVDDVVDKVTSMGFSRDVVRATVRRLTENGQSVDLNVVLDKLMNDGEGQPPRGWFGR